MEEEEEDWMARLIRRKRRDLLRALEEAGCTKAREGGSHEIWSTPGGKALAIPRTRIHRNVVATITSALRSEAIEVCGFSGM